MNQQIRLPLGQIEFIESSVDERERITLALGYTDMSGQDHIIFTRRLDDAQLNALQDVIEATQQMLMTLRESKRQRRPVLDDQGNPLMLLGLPVYYNDGPPIASAAIDAFLDAYRADAPPTDEVIDDN